MAPLYNVFPIVGSDAVPVPHDPVADAASDLQHQVNLADISLSAMTDVIDNWEATQDRGAGGGKAKPSVLASGARLFSSIGLSAATTSALLGAAAWLFLGYIGRYAWSTEYCHSLVARRVDSPILAHLSHWPAKFAHLALDTCSFRAADVTLRQPCMRQQVHPNAGCGRAQILYSLALKPLVILDHRHALQRW